MAVPPQATRVRSQLPVAGTGAAFVRRALVAFLVGLLVSFSCTQAAWSWQGTQEELVDQLARRPELMSLDYLKLLIGAPENERSQRANPTKTYYWYDGQRRLEYELQQSESQPGAVVESIFVAFFRDREPRPEDVARVYGPPSRRLFDYNSDTAEVYTFAPHTSLVFSSRRNSFRVQRAKVAYRGPALARPSVADMAVAEQKLLDHIAAACRAEDWQAAVPMLEARLRLNPTDSEAYYALGRGCVRLGRIHEAILYYKAALAHGQQDPALRAKCARALRDLRVLPDGQIRPTHNLKTVSNGQRLRVAGPSGTPAAVPTTAAVHRLQPPPVQ